jgi:serine O-acetyltransferase
MARKSDQRSRTNTEIDNCRDEFGADSTYRECLPEIIKSIAASCRDKGNYDHVGAALIPSWTEVVDIVDLLRDILFPGYFGDQHIAEVELEYHLGAEVTLAFDKLSTQIARTVRHDCLRYRQICSQCVERGQHETVTFLAKIPALRAMLATDVRAAYQGDPAAKTHDEIVFAYPGLFAIMVYRLAHELWLQQVPLLPRMMTEFAHGKTGIDIHPGATIGESFFIDHGTGVVVGETTIVGQRVRVYQGVTLGAKSVPRNEQGDLMRGAKRHPTIEDDVTIYSNATILGGDTVVGARSIIGGNVWLTESVPPDTAVLQEHPPLIFRSQAKAARGLG